MDLSSECAIVSPAMGTHLSRGEVANDGSLLSQGHLVFDLALDVPGGILTETTSLGSSFDIEMPAVPPAFGD